MSSLINRPTQLSANGRCSAGMGGSKAFAAKPMVHRSPRSSTIMAATPAKQDKLLCLKWAQDQVRMSPGFFNRLKDQQSPEYLWIGCADSRVPASTILGLDPGEVFVQRNVGNQFSVTALGVSTIIVCGRGKCGAVKAALTLPSKTPGMTNCWIADIRESRNQHMKELTALPFEQQVEKLCEYNVLRQVYHVCTSPIVQQWWDEGKEMNVYGLVYSLEDGLLKQLAGPITSNKALGTDNETAFVNETMQNKETGFFSSMKALLGEQKTEPAVPAPAKKCEIEGNNEKLSKKIAEHAKWDQGGH
eukprot:gene8116-1364_t